MYLCILFSKSSSDLSASSNYYTSSVSHKGGNSPLQHLDLCLSLVDNLNNAAVVGIVKGYTVVLSISLRNKYSFTAVYIHLFYWNHKEKYNKRCCSYLNLYFLNARTNPVIEYLFVTLIFEFQSHNLHLHLFILLFTHFLHTCITHIHATPTIKLKKIKKSIQY